MSATTLRDSLVCTRRALAAFLPDHGAEREARLMLCHVLQISSAQLISRLEEAWPDAATARRFQAIVAAREARQPLSQILGQVAFYGRDFAVSPDVLTPRADSETLIDMALCAPFQDVLDLGTGSGCLLGTLLAERLAATGIGIDISEEALCVADRNLVALGVRDRARLQVSDWFAEVTGRVSLIVANPPYIPADALADLMPEVRDHEPRIALSPGRDGLAVYRHLVAEAPGYLRPGGRLIVEIGADQGAAVLQMFQEAGFRDPRLVQDLNGKDRVVGALAP